MNKKSNGRDPVGRTVRLGNYKMKHFSELTKEEVNKMWNRCVDAAISYSKEINMSGLSHNGSHNIYTALENAIHDEWEKSKQAMKNDA